ncbi:predicted protein [Lichtheimia corymbifera JMRC:FSU:9682]|uniref:Uncharacterized protein n=1 Tax=Lichtheimia corymbifera JMRC:FSU:9682 TaxID=1263082 RepID=A0A068S7V0_9FUNG|nr:predicted protein [Lichtheimia corymbifera JMRC:FSU:9682]
MHVNDSPARGQHAHHLTFLIRANLVIMAMAVVGSSLSCKVQNGTRPFAIHEDRHFFYLRVPIVYRDDDDDDDDDE